ncbi:MAG: peptidase M1, partial [Calditrichaeota bacterium]
PNGKGVAYGLFLLDSTSQSYLMKNSAQLRDPLLRGVAWLDLWDGMLEGQRSMAPVALFRAGLKALPREKNELVAQRMLNDLTTVFWRYLTPETREQFAAQLEQTLWRLMEQTPVSSLKASYFNTYRRVALSPQGVEKLFGVWQQRIRIPGLELAERDYMSMALELAVRGIAGADQLLQTQLGQISNPDRKARFEFVMPAVSADSVTRHQFFEGLKKAENREHEPWVLEGLRYLHHPLRANSAVQYILPGLELLQEIQTTGDIFFPKRWLDATLGGHQSPQAAEVVQYFLQTHPQYPPRLKAKILQSADGLFRAARLVFGWQGGTSI